MAITEDQILAEYAQILAEYAHSLLIRAQEYEAHCLMVMRKGLLADARMAGKRASKLRKEAIGILELDKKLDGSPSAWDRIGG
jgi:hypothetical protein